MKKFTVLFLLALCVVANSVSAQTNLISNWCAGTLTGSTSKPTDVGWLCTPIGGLGWNTANTSPGCRFLDYNVAGGHTGFTFNGTNVTSRIMYIRWDSSNSGSFFTYPVTLTACQNYLFSFKYSLAANQTNSTITVAVCTSTDGTTGTIATKDFDCSTTLKTVLSGSLSFTPPSSGQYYLSFKSSTASMNTIADLSVVANTTPSLTTSQSTLSFDDINNSRSFTLTGNYLTDSVKLTPPAGILLSKNGFTATEAQCGATVTATFDGSRAISNDSIVIKSGTSYSKTVKVGSFTGDGLCFTPLYNDKQNLFAEPCMNNLSSYSGWGITSIDSVAGEPYCGKSCGKVGTGQGSIDYNLNLAPYTRYRMKAMVKTVGGSFQIGVSKYDGTTGDINQVFNTNGQWQVIDFTFNTGQVVTGALTFFNNYLKDGTIGYIDNWELYALGTIEGKTEVFTTDAKTEANVKATIRELLAKHLPYAEGKFVSASGYFGNGQSVEHGARTNADYALIYSFIYKKCQDQALPNGLTFDVIKQRALAAIRYSYSSHKTGTVNCTDGIKWGLVWESSMWCTSTAYASWLMWDDLTAADKAAVKSMIMAEANYKLSTAIPTGINSDTKAEENGWDTNILAIAAAMFPEEKNAEAWDLRCKQYAVNTYSVAADIYNKKEVDGKTVADWHIGGNLFPDYALENHNFFHTSYLNVATQELSESLLAYKAVQNQSNPVFPIPAALKHNVAGVWNSMLKNFILADGNLAMPNGNDWSMYIFDEISSYSALACIYRDPDALMLESIILQYAKMRQATAGDGAFLLNPDVAERRMAVTARRLVFAHLYHDYFPTSDMTPTTWTDFSRRYETTKYLPYSGIIRSNSDDKYTTFSWFQSTDGSSYKSYMGMVSPNDVNNSNIVFPFKAGNGGNFTGYVDISGKTRNASYVSSTFTMYPKSFATTGRLNVTDACISKYLSFYSTPGKAVIYHEDMVGATAGTITKDGGLMVGITTDVLTRLSRNLYSASGLASSNGNVVSAISGNWVNVDNILGMVVNGGNGIAFGEKELSTSIYVSKLYGSYSTTSKTYAANDLVYSRSAIVYPKTDAATTQSLATKEKYPTVLTGWKATAAEDPDGRRYLLMSNFRSTSSSSISFGYGQGAPVFDRVTTVADTIGKAVFNTMSNASAINELCAFVKTAGTDTLKAVQGNTPYSVYLKNEKTTDIPATVSIWNAGSYQTINVTVQPNTGQFVRFENNVLTASAADFPEGYRNVGLGKQVTADNQHPDHFPFAIIDQIDSTSYQSLTLPTATTPQNLTIRLMGLYACNKLNIKSVDGIGAKDIEIQTSSNGTSFTTVATATLSNQANWQTVNFTESDAKYLRIKITSSYGSTNVGVAEVELFGYPK